jgi:hypothetical protein
LLTALQGADARVGLKESKELCGMKRELAVAEVKGVQKGIAKKCEMAEI